jgi:hypothetical protein
MAVTDCGFRSILLRSSVRIWLVIAVVTVIFLWPAHLGSHDGLCCRGFVCECLVLVSMGKVVVAAQEAI